MLAGLTADKMGLELYLFSEYGRLNGPGAALITGLTSEAEEADAEAEAAAAVFSSGTPDTAISGEATDTLEELLSDTVFSMVSEMTPDDRAGSMTGAQGTADSSTTTGA